MPYRPGLSDQQLPTHAAADACQQVSVELEPRLDLALLFITRPTSKPLAALCSARVVNRGFVERYPASVALFDDN